MEIKNLHIIRFCCLLLIIALWGCNSKGYQNLNARYNGYFYADQYLNEVYQAFEERYAYNFDEILRIFPQIDSAIVKSNKEKLDDAFKKSSQTIEWWKASDWVDDSYLIIGKIRYLRAQWQFAIETFQYINQNSNDDPTRQKALIALMRTYMDMGNYDQAEEVAGFLDLEKLEPEVRASYLLTKAFLFQQLDEYGKVKELLTEAQPLINDKTYSLRVNFILGQLAQQAGEYRNAYLYYDNALKGNPPYEVMFHARLNKLIVSGYSNPNNVDEAYKVFDKMLRDGKNKEYMDHIYYTMGLLEQHRNKLSKAVENYRAATRVEQPNNRQQGLAFLRLAEIHYDHLLDFNLASAYYDSAVMKLPKDIERFDEISKRQKVLKDFVTQLNIIEKNDSLLTLAQMNPISLEAYLGRYLDAKEAKERAKERGNNNANSTGLNRTDDSNYQAPDGSNTWYFYNRQAVGQGQLEFQRLWGNRPLENNWRRSLKQTIGLSSAAQTDNDISDDPNKGAPQPDLKSSRETDIDKLMATVPFSEEAQLKVHKEIQDAYFSLGRIYRFGLAQNQKSIITYEKLLERYPQTEHRLDVLYALFTLYEPLDAAKAQHYKQSIIEEFPETLLAKTLINPNYLQEKAARNLALQQEYARAYEAYESGDYILADQRLRAALASFEDVDFLPTVELLAAILKAKTESIVSYEQALKDFIAKYPEEPQSKYAQNLLAAIAPTKNQLFNNLNNAFSEDFQQVHLVAFTFSESVFKADNLKQIVNTFNQQKFESQRLSSSYLNFSPVNKTGILFINSFKTKSAAEIYRKLLEEELVKQGLKSDSNFHNFAISRDNFTQLFQNKALEEYLTFHQKFYK
ncbi:type IX secretion system periplasmic lipoprotein PorW/SprE [Roseivirga thermotolerans]|uniref:Tetratricopeptide repeat protein n=1 Tax=Roseivirga thermotolerans TaxID=1758176 RepID=A0ABQ3I104_9BACT|nr:hypothetical protein [Roseivirga thermotolerans]GHE54206.1 hypothetical protein GCM10011340_05980 [Roseivirga thermotolerans]